MRSRHPTAYEVIDHWPADPHAIGIAARRAPSRFAYMSTLDLAPGRYTVHLECAPDSRTGTPYEDDDYYADMDFAPLTEFHAERRARDRRRAQPTLQ